MKSSSAFTAGAISLAALSLAACGRQQEAATQAPPPPDVHAGVYVDSTDAREAGKYMSFADLHNAVASLGTPATRAAALAEALAKSGQVPYVDCLGQPAQLSTDDAIPNRGVTVNLYDGHTSGVTANYVCPSTPADDPIPTRITVTAKFCDDSHINGCSGNIAEFRAYIYDKNYIHFGDKTLADTASDITVSYFGKGSANYRQNHAFIQQSYQAADGQSGNQKVYFAADDHSANSATPFITNKTADLLKVVAAEAFLSSPTMIRDLGTPDQSIARVDEEVSDTEPMFKSRPELRPIFSGFSPRELMAPKPPQ
ncbi:MAG TPA: hypothetical protein VFR09_01160 [Alphaproteobacteria bacterium]|nr:hypothetical protein [Alphaproteobacteria bacterium]